MTADEPFLRAIRQNPYDALPIGVYADYLDESGSELLDVGQIESVREAWDRAQRGREEEARAIMSVLFLQLRDGTLSSWEKCYCNICEPEFKCLPCNDAARRRDLVSAILSDGTPVSIPAGEAPSF